MEDSIGSEEIEKPFRNGAWWKFHKTAAQVRCPDLEFRGLHFDVSPPF